MKNLLTITLFFMFLGISFAQKKEVLTPEEKAKREKNIQAGNPFKKFGYTPKIATLSKGKYLEFHDLDSIVPVGSLMYNVYTKKIVSFKSIDTLGISEATLKPEVISRWMNPDPLSDEFPDKSPYNFVNNNPIRYIDPLGLAPEDIITIKKNGSIERQKTNDNYDIVQNEAGDKSIKIDHKNGASQIGEVKTVDVKYSNSNTTEQISYFTIENNEVATQVFEFAAGASETEFALDTFSFGDGTETNAITLGSTELTGGTLGGEVSPIGFIGDADLGGGKLVKDATWVSNSHSHPQGGWVPSGFRGYLKNDVPTFRVDNTSPAGDRGAFSGSRKPQNTYLYTTGLKFLGGGYIKYNSSSAKYIGKKKK